MLRLKLSVSYPIEFVIHYNLITCYRYAAVISIFILIEIAIVNQYVYALCNKFWHHAISIYPNNQVQYDYSDINAATLICK